MNIFELVLCTQILIQILWKIKIMYRSTSPQFHKHDQLSNTYSAYNYDVPLQSPAGNQALQKLLRNNQDLQERLNQQRSKNFDLLELKRRMEEDIRKLQFELQRIASYEQIANKEGIIKSNQLAQDNQKIKKQMDQYFEENKQLRAEVRKYRNQCQKLQRQKQDLVTQNVTLLHQVANMKGLIANERQQRFSEVQTLRSQQIKSEEMLRAAQYNPNSIHIQAQMSPYQNKYMQVSTNPSYPYELPQPKNPHKNQQKQMQKQFYENAVDYNECNPSPRSFSNNYIQRNLTQASEYQQQPLKQQPNLYSAPSQYQNSHHRNQVVYTNYNSPIQGLGSAKYSSYHLNSAPSMKINIVQEVNPEKQQMNNGKKFPLNLTNLGENNAFGDTRQKKSLKNEVAELRDGILRQLLNKYYRKAIEEAEEHKTNSLKLFIDYLNPKMEILEKMALNYLEARETLSTQCPTIRKKWENTSECDHNSSNNRWVYNVYSSIKNNAKKQKSLAGQFLAMFRTLTLLDKIQDSKQDSQKTVDQVLLDNIKHSTIKFIHRAFQEKKITYGRCEQ